MENRSIDVNQEPLWFIPPQVRERAFLDLEDSDYRSFRLSGIYCGVNAFFLLLFGIYATNIGDTLHAVVLFTLAGIILAGYTLIWVGDWYMLAKYFTTGTMVLLCLYLFYTGGLQNTGPLYYFAFPSMALFLHGRLRGVMWVILLLLITVGLWYGMFDFDVDRYNNVFVSRLVGICFLITLLSAIPEYYRTQAESKLLLCYNDLEALTYGDLMTGLANRNLLEKILQLECNRNQRYDTACCLMLFEADPISSRLSGTKTGVDNVRLLTVLAAVLRKNLRVQDIAGRWENNRFMLVLPQITLEGASTMAGRLLEEVRSQSAALGKKSVTLTASIGVAALNKGSPQEVLERASHNLHLAQEKNGNCYVAL